MPNLNIVNKFENARLTPFLYKMIWHHLNEMVGPQIKRFLCFLSSDWCHILYIDGKSLVLLKQFLFFPIDDVEISAFEKV